MAVRETSLSGFVYEKLMQKICSQAYQAGSRLPSEESLAREFRVSRPVVREALSQLREEGIIQSRRGAGSFLIRCPREPKSGLVIESWSDILHCYEYRATLESRIAALAARYATEEDIRKITEVFEHQKREFFSEPEVRAAGDEETKMDRDFAFHHALACATHNRFYIEAVQMLHDEMRESMYLITLRFQTHKERHFKIVSEEHGWIVNAVRAKNPELAEAAMKLHILNARDSLLPTAHSDFMQGLTEKTSEKEKAKRKSDGS